MSSTCPLIATTSTMTILVDVSGRGEGPSAAGVTRHRGDLLQLEHQPGGQLMGARDASGTYVVDDDDRRRFAEDGFVHLPGVLDRGRGRRDRGRLRPLPAPRDRRAGQGLLRHGRRLRPRPVRLLDRQRDAAPPLLPGVAGQRVRAADRRHRRAAVRRGHEIDYDQLLAKQPHKADAVFAWHQDMAYWPATAGHAARRRSGSRSTTRPSTTAACGSCPRPSTRLAAAARAGVRRPRRVPRARHRVARRRRGRRRCRSRAATAPSTTSG